MTQFCDLSSLTINLTLNFRVMDIFNEQVCLISTKIRVCLFGEHMFIKNVNLVIKLVMSGNGVGLMRQYVRLPNMTQKITNKKLLLYFIL